jgi:DNA polymerase-3 subunit gamma/tau
VLDQLAAGATDEGITYDRAVSILGYTDAALLDESVDAFTAGDGAAVFQSVDRVIEAGLDPRRFAQDLLERFRDLLVLDAVPDAGETGLLDCPADMLERMRGQAARFGRPSLSRAGDVLATALVDMRGTTSPRLVLELACARILLPAASDDNSALLARLDRLEKRLSVTGVAAVAPAPTAPVVADADIPEPPPEAHATPPTATPTQEPDPVAVAVPSPVPVAAGAVDVAALRRLWDDVLDAVKQRNRSAHAMLKEYAHVGAVDARTVTLAFNNAAIGRNFEPKADFFREALREVAGIDLQVKVSADAAPAGSTPAARREDRDEPDAEAPPAPPPADVVDVSDASLDDESADPETESVDAVSLLQQGLDAQVIGEIDGA